MHQGWTPVVAPTSFQCDRIGQTLRNTDWEDDTDHPPKACHHAVAQQLPPVARASRTLGCHWVPRTRMSRRYRLQIWPLHLQTCQPDLYDIDDTHEGP